MSTSRSQRSLARAATDHARTPSSQDESVTAPRSRTQLTALQRTAGNVATRSLLKPTVQRQPAPAATDTGFKTAVAASDWASAASAANGFSSDADFLTHLRALPAAQATQIYAAALRMMTGPARVRFTTLVPQVGLPIAYDGAVEAADWSLVVLHLNGFSDADMATLAAALNPAQRQQVKDATPMWGTRVRVAVADADFKAAITASDWIGAANAIKTISDADMLAHLRSVPLPQVSLIYTAALRTLTGMLRESFTTLVPQVNLAAAVTGELAANAWDVAAQHMNGFSDADLKAKVAAMTQADWLAMLPEVQFWNYRVYRELLLAVLPIELAASDYSNAMVHLNGLSAQDAVAVLTPLPRPMLSAIQMLASAMYPGDSNNSVRRAVAFVLTAQGPRAGNVIGGAVIGGTGPATPVTGGTAAVSANVTIPGTATPDWFGVTYQDAAGGAQAPSTGWVQFISIEIESYDKDDDSLGFEDSPTVPSAVAGFPITLSEPDDRHWYVDTLGGSAPFYEAPTTGGGAASGGAHQTTPNMTAMYDRPASDPNVVRAMFSRKKVKRVVERERFHDYLVRGTEVLYRSELYVRFEWTSAPAAGAGDPPRLNMPVSSGAANKMQPDEYANLVSRYPAYSYFPH